MTMGMSQFLDPDSSTLHRCPLLEQKDLAQSLSCWAIFQWNCPFVAFGCLGGRKELPLFRVASRGRLERTVQLAWKYVPRGRPWLGLPLLSHIYMLLKWVLHNRSFNALITCLALSRVRLSFSSFFLWSNWQDCTAKYCTYAHYYHSDRLLAVVGLCAKNRQETHVLDEIKETQCWHLSD